MLGTVSFLIKSGDPSHPSDYVQSLALKTILSDFESFMKVVALDVYMNFGF
jgi:hypothetical protein